MQTTTTFHCRGHAAEARITPWCGKNSATPPHAILLPHRMNGIRHLYFLHLRFLLLLLLHLHCIRTACMESSVLHVWNHSLKVQYERVMTLQQRWQQISSTQKIQLLHVAVTWTDPCGSDVNWSMWKWHRFALLLSPHHYIAATLNKRNQAFTVFPIFAVTAATSELLLHRQCGLAD